MSTKRYRKKLLRVSAGDVLRHLVDELRAAPFDTHCVDFGIGEPTWIVPADNPEIFGQLLALAREADEKNPGRN